MTDISAAGNEATQCSSALCKLHAIPGQDTCLFHLRARPHSWRRDAVTLLVELANSGNVELSFVDFDEVALEGIVCKHDVVFSYCTFTDCSFSDSTFEGQLVLDQCTIKNSLLRKVHVSGEARFRGLSCTATAGRSGFELRSCQFDQGLQLLAVTTDSLLLDDSVVSGGSDISFLKVIGSTGGGADVRSWDCEFRGAFHWIRPTINGTSLKVGKCTFGGEAFIDGDIHVREINVGMLFVSTTLLFQPSIFAKTGTIGPFSGPGTVEFRQARLRGIALRGDCSRVNLAEADLADADLTKATGFQLDTTKVQGARLLSRSPDQWSTLRRAYSGPMFALHLLLLGLFLAPLAARALMLQTTSQMQGVLVAATTRLSKSAPTSVLDGVNPCLAPRCEDRSLAAVLLGADKPFDVRHIPAWWPVVIVVCLYNLLRFALTYFVSLARDAEERSGYSPEVSGLWGYGWLWRCHRVMRIAFAFVLLTAAWHVVDWLYLTTVSVPSS